MSARARSHIRSREHLLHMLAEASELEHNLLCSYLYAAFSLKCDVDEGLEPAELAAVTRWRGAIMQVCMEEMTHLAQVANLMVALGSRPHFDRPNLPVAPGYHPARIRVSLAPFDLQTIDHFIYLERPDGSSLEDAQAYRPSTAYVRYPEVGVLMPSAPDYETIGEFYALLESGLGELCGEMGESALFTGPANCQLRPEEIGSNDLIVVTGLRSATDALRMIVVQGEGAPSASSDSHFEKFTKIKAEFQQLCQARGDFRPSRNVARNPVMRRPIADERVHVTDAAAAPLLDAANAVYSLMLRCLTAVYDTPARPGDRRAALLGAAIGLMKTLAGVSNELTRLPGNATDGVNAGVSFAMLRSTEGLAPGVDIEAILKERLSRITVQIPELALSGPATASLVKLLDAAAAALA
jgi:hypothetical protein